jgi:Autographiviridae endonuclease
VPKATTLQSFWKRVIILGPDDCWLWTLFLDKDGYGQVRWVQRYGRQVVKVHRVVLELELGRFLEKGEQANHTCNQPSCCNPAHIYLGTQQDNIADTNRQGRARGRYSRKETLIHEERHPYLYAAYYK